MISTSNSLTRWLQHVSGEVKLPVVLQPLLEAVELNRDRSVLSTFGQRCFPAMIGFIDMRGFSKLSKGCSPEQVRDIAAPFVEVVVKAASKHHCFIDKTIGDEVMLVMPSIGEDVPLADIGLAVRDPWPIEISSLVFDILTLLEARSPRRTFSAGFAFGDVILQQVGNEIYGEWTVYGTVVNAASRIRSIAASSRSGSQNADSARVAVG